MSSPFSGGPPPNWTRQSSRPSSGRAGAVIAVILGLGVFLVSFCIAGVFAFWLVVAQARPPVRQQVPAFPSALPPLAVPAPAQVAPPAQVASPPLEATPAPAADHRTEWSYSTSPEGSSGTLSRGPAGWTETRSDGVTYQFEEMARSDEFIQLYDASRQLYVRLYDDHIEWTRDPANWTRGQEGAWKTK